MIFVNTTHNMANYFEEYNWKKILSIYPQREWNITEYYKILSSDFPVFLNKYINLPILQRLKGIGLLCGTDWTALYKNRFFYSRFDHSIGVALIVWNFTHDKAQTLAGLFHDVSTSVFSHVSDFRKGDALTQTATEEPNALIIKNDKQLNLLLKQDGLSVDQIIDYHMYPVADNEIPCLSADRLEYMFPSGAALEGSWSLSEIKQVYDDITVLKNEQGQDELGFNTLEIAEEYCRKFCMTGHVLQLNENKLCLQLMGKIMNLSVEYGLLLEDDFMILSEKDLLNKLEKSLENQLDEKKLELKRLYKTFRTMTSIEHTDLSLSPNEYFCVNLKVKQRFINPLVKINGKIQRLSLASKKAEKIIKDFLDFSDTDFGCVKLVGLE